MLQTGDQLPHFSVTALDGRRVNYSTIWQRRILVLVSLPAEESMPLVEVSEFVAEMRGASQSDAECVITRDRVDGVPGPGAVVADRWGEVVHVASSSKLPPAQDLIEWVEHVRNRCPECEGEAK